LKIVSNKSNFENSSHCRVYSVVGEACGRGMSVSGRQCRVGRASAYTMEFRCGGQSWRTVHCKWGKVCYPRLPCFVRYSTYHFAFLLDEEICAMYLLWIGTSDFGD